jgi:hypothetical protein
VCFDRKIAVSVFSNNAFPIFETPELVMSTLELLHAADITTMRTLLGVKQCPQMGEEAISINSNLLKTNKESVFQKLFSSQHKKTTHLLDTHNSNSNSPYFTSLTSTTITRTAKPDAISTALPMVLEFKGGSSAGNQITDVEWDVLTQGTERLLAQVSVYGYLRTSLVFAISPYFAWILVFRRKEGHDLKTTESLTIARISHADVCLLWSDLTQAAILDPSFYLIDEAPLLLRALRSRGLSYLNTRVQLAGEGMSKVFKVKVGNDDGSSIDMDSYDFAVKTLTSTDEFTRE